MIVNAIKMLISLGKGAWNGIDMVYYRQKVGNKARMLITCVGS
jgi:hypothetical protein